LLSPNTSFVEGWFDGKCKLSQLRIGNKWALSEGARLIVVYVYELRVPINDNILSPVNPIIRLCDK